MEKALHAEINDATTKEKSSDATRAMKQWVIRNSSIERDIEETFCPRKTI